MPGTGAKAKNYARNPNTFGQRAGLLQMHLKSLTFMLGRLPERSITLHS